MRVFACWVFSAVFLTALGAASFSQDASTQEGEVRLRDYVLGKSSSLGNYVCKQSFTITSDASSPVLLAANATAVFARSDEYGIENFSADGEVIDGAFKTTKDIVNGVELVGSTPPPPLAKGVWAIFRAKGEPYRFSGKKFGGRSTVVGTSSSPFIDWPLISYTMIARGETLGHPKTSLEFIKEWMTCTSAVRKGKHVISYFSATPDQYGNHAFFRLTFDGDDIVRSEFGLASKTEKLILADVATKWKESEFGESLPSSVHARLYTQEKDYPYVDYVVDFEWYFPGSPEFAEAKATIENLRGKLRIGEQPAK